VTYDHQAPSWNELEPIWQKWTHLEIPPSIIRSLERAETVLREFLFELEFKSVRDGTVSPDQAASAQRGADLAEAMASSVRASFMIGLELGSRLRESPSAADTLSREGAALLDAAAQPPLLAGMSYIVPMQKAKKLSVPQAQALIERLRTLVKSMTQSGYSIGAQYSRELPPFSAPLPYGGKI
jgi:hypothetical protein